MRQSPAGRLWGLIQGVEVSIDEIDEEIVHLRITSRWARMLGFEVSAYLVGDLLVDTGFRHVRRQVMGALEGQTISAICCTHNHEDHSGNCTPLAERHGCPAYLRNVDARWGEGVRHLKPYRAWWWGSPGRLELEEMPEIVEGKQRRLRAIPSPGHSHTHVALWEEASGTVFTGDLFIAPGASAVLYQENPFDLVESLHRVADLEPRVMLTGHGFGIVKPATRLRAKADRVETAAARALELHRSGMDERTIVRTVFPTGNSRDRMLELLTQGEFSRVNFVRAVVKHGSDRN